MWRGFSGQDDYDHDYGWATWIWAPKSCAFDHSWEGKVIDLTIAEVEFFKFNNSSRHTYEVGVNIRVEEYDELLDSYTALEGLQFNGRYSLIAVNIIFPYLRMWYQFRRIDNINFI